jgi:tRNA(Leu) C34 or U34 (ribose-2'-O)-methylase TrmL
MDGTVQSREVGECAVVHEVVELGEPDGVLDSECAVADILRGADADRCRTLARAQITATLENVPEEVPEAVQKDLPDPSVELTTNGVGPWKDPLPTEPFYDPVLLVKGDSRNVVDRYRYWTMEAIVADLDLTRHPFHVAIENWQHDMNIGSIVRSANAFGADTVHIIGRKRWNKRGAMVTDRYQHVMYHPDVASFANWAADASLPVIAIDNVPGSVIIETFEFPSGCVLLFGQEGPGLSDEAIACATSIVEISQFGSTRSLNASAAAAVAMHSWVLQHATFGR